MAGIIIEEGPISKYCRLYCHLTRYPVRQAMKLGYTPELSLTRLPGSHPVFLLEARDEHRKYVLKSFVHPGASTTRLIRRLNREYECLQSLQRMQAGGKHSRCVRPICRDTKALFFIEEAVCGKDVRHYAAAALQTGDNSIYRKLDLLSGFLSDLHIRTRTGMTTGSRSVKHELIRHAKQSFYSGSIQLEALKETGDLVHRWCRARSIRKAGRSLVHGDVTVSNFLFRDGHMYAIDLERSKAADPVYDLGMMAGELFNEAILYTGNPYLADPYIGYLYRSYASHFKDAETVYAGAVARNPLYMANSLFRMSRNNYYSSDHRKTLAYYAMECLRSSPPG